uniref:Uncharacterized protein n=1 Tax=Rhizophora mucronata TaxID=61149 RepID=A0A2P2J5P1_RHIMU
MCEQTTRQHLGPLAWHTSSTSQNSHLLPRQCLQSMKIWEASQIDAADCSTNP